MRFDNLDLNLLVALDVLLDECNITRASERLNMTQSATSGVLRRLRDYFEDDLLTQTGRKMQPTPYALELRDPIREILVKIRSSITTKRSFDPSTCDRNIRIVCTDFVVTVLIRKVIQNIQRLAPDISIEILTPTESSDTHLIRGEVDFLLMPEPFITKGHPSELIFEEEHVCVAWTENDLIGDEISYEQYMSMGHISVGIIGSTTRLSIEDSFMKEQNVQRRIEVKTSDFNSLPLLVVGTNRIATMHKRLAQFFAEFLPIRIFPTPVEAPILREHLQWHKSMDNDPLSRWIRQQIHDVANQLD
jgi:DNA-binding transcriptional LysR family regulator